MSHRRVENEEVVRSLYTLNIGVNVDPQRHY